MRRSRKTGGEIITGYYEKIVVTRGITEVWKYEKLNVNSGGYHEGDGEHKEENYKQRQRKRRNTIRQLICTNFDSNSKFITLTFNDSQEHDIKNVQECNAYFRLFILRLKYQYPDLKYVAVIEFQDKNERGAVHYHMVSNLPYVKKTELQKIWGGGFVKINAIDKVDNVGAYVVKYMVADMDDKRLCGEQAYLRSRALEKPLEVTTWRESDNEVFRAVESSIQGKTPTYSAKYVSADAGEILYYQYNDNR